MRIFPELKDDKLNVPFEISPFESLNLNSEFAACLAVQLATRVAPGGLWYDLWVRSHKDLLDNRVSEDLIAISGLILDCYTVFRKQFKVRYLFGNRSTLRFRSAHPYLALVGIASLDFFDTTILSSHRSDEEQYTMLKAQPPVTRVGPEKSQHCRNPSMAVDLAVSHRNGILSKKWPKHTGLDFKKIDYRDRSQQGMLAGDIMRVSSSLGFMLTNGADWNGTGRRRVNTTTELYDPWHFEINYDRSTGLPRSSFI